MTEHEYYSYSKEQEQTYDREDDIGQGNAVMNRAIAGAQKVVKQPTPSLPKPPRARSDATYHVPSDSPGEMYRYGEADPTVEGVPAPDSYNDQTRELHRKALASHGLKGVQLDAAMRKWDQQRPTKH